MCTITPNQKVMLIHRRHKTTRNVLKIIKLNDTRNAVVLSYYQIITYACTICVTHKIHLFKDCLWLGWPPLDVVNKKHNNFDWICFRVFFWFVFGYNNNDSRNKSQNQHQMGWHQPVRFIVLRCPRRCTSPVFTTRQINNVMWLSAQRPSVRSTGRLIFVSSWSFHK